MQIHRIWISYLEPLKQFLSDNGGELSNEVFHEMNEKLNIETRKRRGETPSSTVERHYKVLSETFSKHWEDVGCCVKQR